MNNFENYDYETDEGYAEDDDEEDSDSDNSLPLEIPFKKVKINARIGIKSFHKGYPYLKTEIAIR